MCVLKPKAWLGNRWQTHQDKHQDSTPDDKTVMQGTVQADLYIKACFIA